jgi:hypothetical protein
LSFDAHVELRLFETFLKVSSQRVIIRGRREKLLLEIVSSASSKFSSN